MRSVGFLLALLALFCGCSPAGPSRVDSAGPAAARPCFAIHVVDDQTGRGVPLVELATVNHVRYVTDSGGWAAIDDPSVMGHDLYLSIFSHGYEHPADGFGSRGVRVLAAPGGEREVKVHRVNIAERLYRITGEGIYRDSVMLAKPAPIDRPLLNAQVVGQDSAQCAVYRGRVWWFFGDTQRESYPLGHFGTSAATSKLPADGGLAPGAGVNLDYFVDRDGFSRPMFQATSGEPAWLDGVAVVRDKAGADRLVGRISHMSGMKALRREIVAFNDATQAFDTLAALKDVEAPALCGQVTQVESGGRRFLYFGKSYPNMRAPADLDHIADAAALESFTCLDEAGHVARGRDGKAQWTWRRGARPVDLAVQEKLIRDGALAQGEAWFRPTDAQTRKPIQLRGGSVRWNAYRKRWIMIGQEIAGGPSYLGEIWYLEAPAPEGPWTWARKVVTHDRYSFYNPVQHDFFDEKGGQAIYFEGTYTATFSRSADPTPRYDYNQVMYRLDLADPRLKMPDAPPGG